MRTEMGAVSMPFPCRPAPVLSPAEVLCDELTEHTFLCDTCINGHEDRCAAYATLRQKIAEAGGITKGLALTM